MILKMLVSLTKKRSIERFFWKSQEFFQLVGEDVIGALIVLENLRGMWFLKTKRKKGREGRIEQSEKTYP